MEKALIFENFQNDIDMLHNSLMMELISGTGGIKPAYEEFFLTTIWDAVKSFFRKLFGKIGAFLQSLFHSDCMYNIEGLKYISNFSKEMTQKLSKIKLEEINAEEMVADNYFNAERCVLDVKNLVVRNNGMEYYKKKVTYSELNKTYATPITLAQDKIERDLRAAYAASVDETASDETKAAQTSLLNRKVAAVTTLCSQMTACITRMLNVVTLSERNKASDVDLDFSKIELK